MGAERRSRRWSGRLVRVGVWLALLILGLEIALRLVPEPVPPVHELAVEYPFRHMRDGEPDFRDRPYDLNRRVRKEPGLFRVVAVGDAATWGAGVFEEDAWPDRLSRRLDALDSEVRFEVINFSRRAWNTVDQWHALRPLLPRLDPDLVILGYGLNDPEPHDDQDPLRAATGKREPTGASEWLHSRSRIYARLWDAAESARRQAARGDYLHALYRPGPAREAQLEALTGMVERLGRRGVPLLLVILPTFDSPHPAAYPYREIHAMVAADAGEAGAPTLDALTAFGGLDSARLAGEPAGSGHPSELAHRVIADAVLDALLERDLIPARRPEDAELIKIGRPPWAARDR